MLASSLVETEHSGGTFKAVFSPFAEPHTSPRPSRCLKVIFYFLFVTRRAGAMLENRKQEDELVIVYRAYLFVMSLILHLF